MIGLFGALALAGCVKDKPFAPGPGLELVNAYELPPPTGALDLQGRPKYVIGPFDRLGIKVFRVADLDQTVTVDGAGDVTLPLVGTLAAEGKTPEQLASAVEQGLRAHFVRDPQVTVSIVESVSRKVTVEGEVNKPGLYPVVGSTTLLQSIATAEGTTEFSKLNDVVVFRTVGQSRMAALYNIDLIRRGTYPDPTIFAGDKVVVGDSPARRRFKDLLAGSTLITTPIIALIQTL
jgi:polysaccharide export outer membrane protein